MRFWYRSRPGVAAALLWPLTLVTRLVTQRRFRQRHAGRYGAPVLVVGNLTVGGTGKSPAIQALVRHLSGRGLHCGIVSRGYGGRSPAYPLELDDRATANVCGDEPLLLARTLGCPVVVDPDRDRAVRHLLSRHSVDLVISDDGLQHYRMGRNLELVMIDGHRGLGNGCLLPAGPLREPVERLRSVHWRVAKRVRPTGIEVDGVLSLNPTLPVNAAGRTLASGSRIDVCAGIGDPAGFLAQLRRQGYVIGTVTRPGDHSPIPKHLLGGDAGPLVITEKDAVKLPLPWPEHCYVVRLAPQLPEFLLSQIEHAIRSPELWLASS